MLPFRYVPVADQVLVRLRELEGEGAVVGLSGALATAERLAVIAKTFDEAADAVRAGFEAGRGREREAVLLNRAMKRVSRLMVPLMSSAIGKYGHDVYGYTPQGTMIPSLYDVPRLASLPEGEPRWMLQTRVVRNRNLVSDTLSDSIAILEDALALLA